MPMLRLTLGTAEWNLLSLSDEEAQIVVRSHITRRVTENLWRRQIDGATEHGGPMQPGETLVDGIKEALAEAIDMSQYLMKVVMEGNGK